MRIGLFDSGIGGLTVLKKLKETYPHNDYIYFGDILNMPYGQKTHDELLKLSINCIEFLKKCFVDKIIIACGTVSSNVYEELNRKYPNLLIDVISPTIDFLNESKYNNIAIMSTKMTTNSHIFKNKLLTKNITEIACPELASLIEEGIADKIKAYVDQQIKYIPSACEVLVLGCTHYPIIQEYLKISESIKVISLADAVCNKFSDGKTGSINLVFSSLKPNTKKNIAKILGDDWIFKLYDLSERTEEK